MTHFLNFDTYNHISGTSEATVATFCMQVEYIKFLAVNGRLHPNGCSESHDPF